MGERANQGMRCGLVMLAVLLLFGLSQPPLAAAGRPVLYDPSVGTGGGQRDSQDVEAFVDGYLGQRMAEGAIPGAVFVWVKDGKGVLAKGYGYANLETRTPVLPHTTVFRVASISKLFTATAIMQLVERGLVNLGDDVNKYLKHFQIRGDSSTPVTVAHLLTHTHGFDANAGGPTHRRAPDTLTLEQYVIARTQRVIPPGEVLTYGNLGTALAGYLVQEVTGLPFPEYVDQSILKPLKMERSSFRQPPPADLVADLAVGYEYVNGVYEPIPLEYFSADPAGALIATADDIARFMVAHLQAGRTGDARVLREDTAREMQRQHFSYYPELLGMTYGFRTQVINGQRVIWHTGSGWRQYSGLFLFPEENVGFFVACTGACLGLPTEMLDRFVEWYYPPGPRETVAPPPSLQPQPDVLNALAGNYRDLVFPRDSIGKIGTLLSQVHVSVERDILSVQGSGLRPARYQQVEPLLFRNSDTGGYMAFRQPNHQVTYLVSGLWSLEKLPWYESAEVQFGLIALFIAAFVSACARLLASGARLCMGRSFVHVERRSDWAWLVAGGVAALNLIFILGFTLLFRRYQAGLPDRVVPVAVLLFIVPMVASATTIALPFLGVRTLRDSGQSVGERLHYTAVMLASIGFIPFLLYWNLLGFRF